MITTERVLVAVAVGIGFSYAISHFIPDTVPASEPHAQNIVKIPGANTQMQITGIRNTSHNQCYANALMQMVLAVHQHLGTTSCVRTMLALGNGERDVTTEAVGKKVSQMVTNVGMKPSVQSDSTELFNALVRKENKSFQEVTDVFKFSATQFVGCTQQASTRPRSNDTCFIFYIRDQNPQCLTEIADFDEQNFQEHCGACNSDGNICKQRLWWRMTTAPKALFVCYSSRVSPVNNVLCRVNFPVNVSLKLTLKLDSGKSVDMILVAVLLHESNSSANSGHYTCLVHDPKGGLWRYMNDSTTKYVDNIQTKLDECKRQIFGLSFVAVSDLASNPPSASSTTQ